MSEIFCRGNSRSADFLLAQAWWVWREAGIYHVKTITAGTAKVPDSTQIPYQCTENCSLLQAGMQMSIKNKAQFFGEFSLKPSKITPNLFV